MAIIWKKRLANIDYRVVHAGNSIRLYRNNVLHTQWNPRDPIRGQLWELFLLTSFNPNIGIDRVLVLGAGGGAVINLVHYFFPHAEIDAVDLDRTHIQIAKKYFKIKTSRCKFFHADAADWIKRRNRELYDLIIDDVFHEKDKVPFRSIAAGSKWINILLSRLSRTGILTINFADKKEWKKCCSQLEGQKFMQKYQIGIATNRNCQNKIVHITKRPLSATIIKNNLLLSKAKSYLKCWENNGFSYRRVA